MLNTKCGDSITCVYSACKHNNNCHLSWMVIDFMMFPYMRLSLLAFQHIISGQLGNMRQWWPEYLADKPIPSQGQVSPVLWIPNIPIIHFVSLETTINLRQTFVGLRGIGKMLEQHSIMDIPQHNSIHCMNLMNILKVRKSLIVWKILPALCTAVSGSWSFFHNLIILPLIPGYYPYLEIIIHFLNYCRLAWLRFSPGNLESVIDQNFDR